MNRRPGRSMRSRLVATGSRRASSFDGEVGPVATSTADPLRGLGRVGRSCYDERVGAGRDRRPGSSLDGSGADRSQSRVAEPIVGGSQVDRSVDRPPTPGRGDAIMVGPIRRLLRPVAGPGRLAASPTRADEPPAQGRRGGGAEARPRGPAFALPGEDPPQPFVPLHPRTVEEQQAGRGRSPTTAPPGPSRTSGSGPRRSTLLEKALKLDPDSVADPPPPEPALLRPGPDRRGRQVRQARPRGRPRRHRDDQPAGRPTTARTTRPAPRPC